MDGSDVKPKTPNATQVPKPKAMEMTQYEDGKQKAPTKADDDGMCKTQYQTKTPPSKPADMCQTQMSEYQKAPADPAATKSADMCKTQISQYTCKQSPKGVMEKAVDSLAPRDDESKLSDQSVTPHSLAPRDDESKLTMLKSKADDSLAPRADESKLSMLKSKADDSFAPRADESKLSMLKSKADDSFAPRADESKLLKSKADDSFAPRADESKLSMVKGWASNYGVFGSIAKQLPNLYPAYTTQFTDDDPNRPPTKVNRAGSVSETGGSTDPSKPNSLVSKTDTLYGVASLRKSAPEAPKPTTDSQQQPAADRSTPKAACPSRQLPNMDPDRAR